MSSIDSLLEKSAGAHRQDPRRAAGPQRAPAHFPHHASGLMQVIAEALALCLIVIGTSLKQLGRRSQPRHVPTRPLSSLGSPHH